MLINASYEFREKIKEIENILTATWKTKDGQKIKPKDMTDTHLINTIKLMQKKAPALHEGYKMSIINNLPDDKDWVDDIDMKYFDNGETAEEWLEDQEIYITLVLEAKLRGLIKLD